MIIKHDLECANVRMSNRTSLASVSSFKSNLGSPNIVSRQSSRGGMRSLGPERNSHFEEFDDSPIYFVEVPPDTLKCRLCEAVFRTPVVLTCGHTVCKTCSYQYSNCAICGTEMRMVVENLSLQEQIGQLEVYCDFGIDKENTQDQNGCPDIIQLRDRKGIKVMHLFTSYFKCNLKKELVTKKFILLLIERIIKRIIERKFAF